MNKNLYFTVSVLSLLCLAGHARADDSVVVNGITFYGTVDVGVTYQNHGVDGNAYAAVGNQYLASKSNNRSTFTMTDNNLGNSKLGLKGAEDLGDGWTGLFKLETGFNPLSGQISDGIHSVALQNGVAVTSQTVAADSTRAGQAFNQAAFVGISNQTYGTLTMGRQTPFQTDAVGGYDPLQTAYAFSPVGFSGAAAASGDTENTRWDDSVKYLGSWGPIRAGLMYQFGGSIARNDTGLAADLGGDYGGFSFDAVYTHKKDAVLAGSLTAAQMATAPADAIAGTVSDNTSYSAQAKYGWQDLKLYAAYEHIRFANPASPLAAGTVDIGGYDIAFPNNTAYTNNKVLQIAWIGARYSVTPKLDLATAWYHYDQNSFKGNGCSDTSASSCSGQMNAFSFLADYRFTKRLDAYAGLMYSQMLGGLANAYLHNNTVDPTLACASCSEPGQRAGVHAPAAPARFFIETVKLERSP